MLYRCRRLPAGSRTELVPAPGQVRGLGGVARQLDRPVVRRARLLAAAQPAQQLRAGAVVGVVAGQRLRQAQQRGTVNHTPVYPREVAKRALELHATALILVHNHPSGDPSPSQADIKMTKAIIDIAAPLGISVHDHIIVGKNGHASLKGMKLI